MGTKQRTENRKRNRDKHKEEGLCPYCIEKVEKDKSLCKYHLNYRKENQKKYRENLAK